MRNWVASIIALIAFVLVCTTGNTATNAESILSKNRTDNGRCLPAYRSFSSISFTDLLTLADTDNYDNQTSFALEYQKLRFRRLQGSFIDAPNAILHLSSLASLSAREQSRTYHSDKLPDGVQSTCDYYVFALRRIFI